MRPGHTEAALDLARASGSYPAGVLCEIVDRRDGSMARTPELQAFAAQHDLRIITIADLIRHRLATEQIVTPAGPAGGVAMRTRHGPLCAHAFASQLDSSEHAAFVVGDALQTRLGSALKTVSSSADSRATSSQQQQQQTERVLVAVHTQRRLADALGAPAAAAGAAPGLDAALTSVVAAGAGVVLYVQGHAGVRGGLAAELTELAGGAAEPGAALHESGAANRAGESSAIAPDLRDAAVAAAMLRALGVGAVALIGDEQDAARLRRCGLDVVVAADVACGGLSMGAWSGTEQYGASAAAAVAAAAAAAADAHSAPVRHTDVAGQGGVVATL